MNPKILSKQNADAELRFIVAQAEKHRPTRERGLRQITMHPKTWRYLREPTHVTMSDGQRVPIFPTGKVENFYRWYYRRRIR